MFKIKCAKHSWMNMSSHNDMNMVLFYKNSMIFFVFKTSSRAYTALQKYHHRTATIKKCLGKSINSAAIKKLSWNYLITKITFLCHDNHSFLIEIKFFFIEILIKKCWVCWWKWWWQFHKKISCWCFVGGYIKKYFN